MSGAFNNDGRGISPLIATSWERCNKLMKRETWNVPHQAQGVTFASIYRRKKAMLTLGQAALEDAWEYMSPRECALFILDETACILSRNGDPQTLQQLSALGFNDGTYCAEGIIGTCALSLAAISGQAVKTMADQHFKQAHPLKHVEATFESQHQFIDAVITLKPIIETQGTSFILLLHPVEQMRQLMTSQLGKVSHTFAHMPQDDPQTRRLIHFGRQAARSSFPVLLCGEEGVGKALLSQAIHNESERAAGPYIAVNCELYGDAALAEEFIGGDRTDNENGRLSRLELAHGGTLFLEKIEYLAVELQSALLQVIKQGVITRLDARRLIPIDVKVIATTTADLAMLVEQNRFSRQLYYALHAFEITIPPLRMRRGSIPALVNNKLRSLEKRFSTRLKIDDDALARLVSCAWPGNDFELYSVIENLALSSDNGRIRVSDLPEHLFTEQATDDVSATRLSTSLSFAEVEKEAIINAAQVTGGRIQEMSALLGIGRTTLWRKMKQHGIDAGQFKRRV
ncbi:PTS-dependent dihydroxyacetone kinase operon transcriptional regulator DhaR [Escherichia coli]|nr:PTS-dependent dihydroxyacetone kinase operon transcriptional regulator DhaR [Escherichia coli]EHK5840162.1 PTS-dependent dihydroxyacetone kinase operon transcriptional regulator DhaR [Escherichia coli]